MKASFTLAAIGASIAAAQSVDSLPECGQTCIQNMISIASSQLGCGQDNVTCYCTEPDFGYGVRDCANEACASSEDAATVISFGTSYCANALQAYTSTASEGAPEPTNSAGQILSNASGGSSSATESGDSDNDNEDATASEGGATATSYLVGVITTDGSTLTTTTGTTLLGGAAGSATSGAGSITSDAGSAVSSATESADSAVSSAESSADNAVSSASEAGESAASSASEGAADATDSAGGAEETADQSAAEQSDNKGPIQTAAPVLIGAAALAIFAL